MSGRFSRAASANSLAADVFQRIFFIFFYYYYYYYYYYYFCGRSTTTTTTFLSLLYNATTSSVLLQTAPSFRSRSSNQLAEPNCSINEFCLNNTSIGEHYVRRNRNPREFTAIQASKEMFGEVRWEVGFQVVIGLSPSYPMPRCAPLPPSPLSSLPAPPRPLLPPYFSLAARRTNRASGILGFSCEASLLSLSAPLPKKPRIKNKKRSARSAARNL
jgi:hypothetical protein